MLDAHPAPGASARPQLSPVSVPASGGAPADVDGPAALLDAARTLLPVLEVGRPLDPPTLRDAMTRAFGASDAAGAWVWKDAYEAAEAAVVLFIQRYGRAMRQRAGADADGPRKMLAMLAAIAALEPSHTKRSEDQVRLQQFSTPLPLAYAALRAAAVRPGDTVLEPSAGTGMLAVMAECALASRAAGHLHLNEIASIRAGLLAGLFPGTAVTRHNAEALADFLPGVRPTVVLMNPPFSATPGIDRIRHDADLRHIRSAFSMLPPGGRLAAITSAHFVPGDAAWRGAFASIRGAARTVFTMAIDGRAYARRGTGFDTRLTVIERSAGPGLAVDGQDRAATPAELLDAVIARVPPRLSIEPEPVRPAPAAVAGRDLFGNAVAPAKTTRKPAAPPSPAQPHDWGPVAELAFAGVIVFDEAHAMANAAGFKGNRGEVKPSQQGRAGLRLQNALPDARIAYVSATGATTVPGLAYAGRLGLWAAGETPFESRTDFISAMEAGGVAAMEVLARDLKALGLYQARALSYDGVEVEILEHPLTPEQRRIYDAYAGAFKVIHHNINEALKATGIVEGDSTLNKNAKTAALSAFEGAKQRFFGHLLTAMKCPSLIRAIEADLDTGRSAVVQLVSTGEALMERRIAEIPASEWDDLSVDLTPRETVIEFLAHAFPVQLQEPFTDDEGNVMSRPVFDDDGNPVICQEAAARRDALIEKLVALPPVQSALDQIVHRFGHEAVAEVTGRSRRVLKITDARGERLALRSRPASANLAETAAFMDATKRILVFSMAGGTGRSYHADLSCANTERRIHYLLEPGWRADQAIQGLGRTHRTHQASAPLFRPVTTDVKGERRFIATIARRLDSLGAITRGQRDSQTAMGSGDQALFRESDNLESIYAKAALRRFYIALWRGHIEGWSLDRFEDATGLKLVYEGNLKEELPPMSRFLNRLLALPIAEQNQLFAELEARIAENIEQAVEAGSFEVGVETVRADSLAILGRETLYEHPGTGAATDLVEIRRRDRLEPLIAEAALDIGGREPGADGKSRLAVNARSKRAAVLLPAPSRMFDDGGVQERVRLVRPATRETMARPELDASNWRPADEATWRTLWEHEISELPSHRESRFWLAAGLLLPIWDRLPFENMRVRRLTTDDGEALIGRVLDAEQVRAARASFGLDGGPAMTGEEAFEAVMARGTALPLANGWRLARRRIMGADRVEIEGPADTDVSVLKRIGCTVEIVSYRARAFVPAAQVLDRILERWPLAA